MNESDIAGIVFIVLGLLCLLPAIYTSPVFVVVSGALIASGIVLTISAGNMCRARQDVAPANYPSYSELRVPEAVSNDANAPSLAKIPV